MCKCILDDNLECECILELRIVPFHFPVTLTLASDLVSRICIKTGAKLRYKFQIRCVDASLDGRVSCTIFSFTVILTSDLVFRIIVSRAFHLYYSS